MKKLYKYFFRGLITILPVALTVYVLYIFLAWMETLTLWILRPLVGSFYIPGMGLLFGVASIVAIGFLVSRHSLRRLLSFAELHSPTCPSSKVFIRRSKVLPTTLLLQQQETGKVW